MSKSKKIVWIVLSVIVLVGVFFGGVAYGKSKTASSTTGTIAFAGRGERGGGAGGFGGLTTGQIICKDATSITVQLMSSGAAGSAVGSKIIFLDSDTKITKTTTGTMTDLAVGTDVSIAGAANADGSMNATTIMIRPNLPQAQSSGTTSTTTPVVQ